MIFTHRAETEYLYETWQSKFSDTHTATVRKTNNGEFVAGVRIEKDALVTLGGHNSLELAKQACRNYALKLSNQMTAWAIANDTN